MNSLYLTPAWDMCLDSSGNIAIAGEPYVLAQDAASAMQMILGECRYDTSIGIDYFGAMLGQSPLPINLLRVKLVAEAMRVPNVIAAQVFFTSLVNRTVTGQVQVKSVTGVVTAATINTGVLI